MQTHQTKSNSKPQRGSLPEFTFTFGFYAKKNLRRARKVSAMAVVALLLNSALARETTNDLTASDSNSGTATSFSFNVGHWTDDLAPHSGSVYFVTNLAEGNNLRTLAANVSATFQGDALTICNSSTPGSPDFLDLKGNANGVTTTVPNLFFNGGGVENGGNVSNVLTGTSLTLLSNGGFFDPQVPPGIMAVMMPIIGSGPFIVGSEGGVTSGNSGGIDFITASNSYTGGTYFQMTQNTTVANNIGQVNGPDVLVVGNTYALGSANGTLSMTNGVLRLNGFSVAVGNLSGPGGAIFNDDPNGTAVTLTIGSGGNGGGTYGGIIQDYYFNPDSTLGLNMVGNGATITLAGANTYSGATTVSAGTLAISGSLNTSSAIAVASGGTLAGTGSVGSATIASGGGVSGSLTLASLTFSGTGTITTSPGVGLTTSSLTANGGSGSVTINVTSSDPIPNGTYNLITYSGSLGGTGYSAFTLGTVQNLIGRQQAALVNGNGVIQLVVTGDSPVWTGAESGTWSTATIPSPKNWNLVTAGTPTDYEQGDLVLFDDTAGSGVTAINISAANVQPYSVTFNNSALNYSLNGSFGITGTTALTMSNNGALTINNANTYSGGTFVYAGTVTVNGSLNSTAPVTVSSGATLAGTGSVGPATIADGGAVSGNLTLSSLTFGGTGTLTTTGAGITVGAITNEGAASSVTINVNNTGGWANGAYTLVHNSSSIIGGTHGFSAFVLGTVQNLSAFQTATIVQSGGSVVLDISSLPVSWTGAASSTWSTATIPSPKNWVTTVTGNSADFVNGEQVAFPDAVTSLSVNIPTASVSPSLVNFNNSSASYVLSGTYGISGGTSLNLNDPGTLTINNANSYSGGTLINAGTLNINNGYALGTGPLTIAGGAIDNTSAGPVTLSANNAQNWNATSGFTFKGTQNLNLGTNAVVMNNSENVIVNANTLTVGGPISGADMSYGLTKAGNGTLILSATNTYAGGTMNMGGTLKMGAPNIMPPGNLTMAPASGIAIFDLAGFSQTIEGLIGSGSGNSVVDNTGVAAATLTISGSGVFAGTIHNTGGALTLNVTGSQELAGSVTLGGGMEVGVNSDGILTVDPGTGVVLGSNGTGVLWVGAGQTANSDGTIDVSQTTNFTADVSTVYVGNEYSAVGGTTFYQCIGELLLGTNNAIIATTSFIDGNSSGGSIPVGNCSGYVSTASSGTTTINTPLLTIGGNEANAQFVLGSQSTLTVAGTNGGSAALAVGNYFNANVVQPGTGPGFTDNFASTLDASQGMFSGTLSSLIVGALYNSQYGNQAATMILSEPGNGYAANHLTVSGPGNVVEVGNYLGENSSGDAPGYVTGSLTLGNLDSASAITSTDNSAAIVLGIVVPTNAAATNAIATLNLVGGSLTINTTGAGIAGGAGYSTLFLNGMTLNAGASSAAFLTGISYASVSANGVTFNTGSYNIGIPQALATDINLGGVPDGGLVKLGHGTLTMDGANSFTGPVLVLAGTFAGTGSFQSGNFTVTNGATLAPGDGGGIGTLTINNTLSLLGTTFMKLNKTASSSDSIQGMTTVNYGGTLSLTNLSGTLAAGDAFTLFNAASYAGAFTTIQPSSPGRGLRWDVSSLSVNGVLKIAVQPSFSAPVVSGANLVLSGTGGTPGGAYTVLTSANLALPLSIWTPVATNTFDGSGNFSFTNAISHAVGAAFYTIAIP